MTAADVTQVAAIELRMFGDPWTARSFKDLIGEGHTRTLVAEDGGVIAGYAIGQVAGGEGEVLNIAVDAPAQRRGIARALLDALLAQLKAGGAATVFLEVRRSNAAAIALYESFGFREYGARRGYYREPKEDALIMAVERQDEPER